METIKIEIKARRSAAVLFAADINVNISEYLRLKAAVEIAVNGGADLGFAYLRDAHLRGADLDGAYLGGAKVDDFVLVGERPVLQLGPIGSRSDYLVAFLTEKGICIRAGCFGGTLAQFSAEVNREHGDNPHGREYAAAIQMIEAHAAIWTPAIEENKAQT